ncbi:MAG TPA: Fe-Mn family superoxide dismutase [Candidatus Subteraquimicrobiales bacterium]
MAEKQVKPLKYSSLDGLSEKQLKEHHDVLYAGYVKKINEIEEKLKTADKSEANATYSLIRELKHEQTFAANGVKLHEGYFENLGGDGEPYGDILDMINDDFGSFNNWKNDLIAAGIAARGWVVLAYDLDDDRLYNISCDLHNQGGVWNSIALVILDVYEHAYFLDYATGRKSYIEVFLKNIDWEYVNSQVKKYDLVKRKAAQGG